MKFTYEIPLDIKGENSNEFVLRSDSVWIPCDEANSDYQRYLRWLENPDADENGTL